jgi:hypothetical protein
MLSGEATISFIIFFVNLHGNLAFSLVYKKVTFKYMLPSGVGDNVFVCHTVVRKITHKI